MLGSIQYPDHPRFYCMKSRDAVQGWVERWVTSNATGHFLVVTNWSGLGTGQAAGSLLGGVVVAREDQQIRIVLRGRCLLIGQDVFYQAPGCHLDVGVLLRDQTLILYILYTYICSYFILHTCPLSIS